MKEILCFGDSNTHGYMPGLGTRYPYDVRWPGVLARLLGAEYHIVEEGMDGRTTAFEDAIQPHRSALGYLYPCLKTHAPLDLVILMLGTNDLKPRFSLNAFDIAAGAERLIRIIRTHLPDGQKQPPRILLVCPPPIGDAVDSGAIGGMFTAAHSTAVSRDLPRYFAPLAQRYGCLYCEAGDYVTTSPVDSVHLTAQGHRALAEALASLIRQEAGC